MSVFNSLGSNYKIPTLWRAFFGLHHKTDAEELRQFLAERYNGKVILTYKGREALQLAIKTVLPPDSLVAINGFTCYAVYRAVTFAGHTVEFLDIEPNNLHFSAKNLEQKVQKNSKVKAVIIQNTLGIPCDIIGIEKVCKQHDIIMIEDLAHSVGTHYADGREVGTVGDFVMLSFGRDKLIDAVSGGALVIRNKALMVDEPKFSKAPKAARARDRIYPALTAKIRFVYKIGLGKAMHTAFKKTGLLSRSVDGELYAGHSLPDWTCALVMDQFRKLDGELQRRRRLAKLYADNLSSDVFPRSWRDQINSSSNLRLPILVKNRSELLAKLIKNKLYISDIWYDSPIAPPRYLKATTYRHQCPTSEKITTEILNLPTHQHVTEAVIIKLCKLINQWQST